MKETFKLASIGLAFSVLFPNTREHRVFVEDMDITRKHPVQPTFHSSCEVRPLPNTSTLRHYPVVKLRAAILLGQAHCRRLRPRPHGVLALNLIHVINEINKTINESWQKTIILSRAIRG